MATGQGVLSKSREWRGSRLDRVRNRANISGRRYSRFVAHIINSQVHTMHVLVAKVIYLYTVNGCLSLELPSSGRDLQKRNQMFTHI